MPSPLPPSKRIAAMMQAGNSIGAVKLAEALVAENKKNPMAWLLLTHVHLRSTKRFDLAEHSAQKCIALAPKDYRGWLETAHALDRLGRHDEALKHITKAARLEPNLPDISFTRALILLNLDQLAPARALLEDLLKRNPDHMGTKYKLATFYERIGDLNAAKRLAEELRETSPDKMAVYSILDNSNTWTMDHPSYQYLENDLLPRLRQTGDRELVDALRVLAIAKNTHKEYGQAIEYWKENKALEGVTHDSKKNSAFVNRLTKNLSAADYLGAPGEPDETPVLIVGMPRCGSTLLAQILSSHPQVHTAGETPALRLTGQKYGFDWADVNAQIRFAKAGNTEARSAFARTYIDHLRQNERASTYVLDKTLPNYRRLGALAAALPRARIIHALRDPMDLCVSCFTSPLNASHDFTRDLKILGEYYTKYRRLMDHWKSILPNPIIEVEYKDVVADTEGKAREVIDFLKLDWDPACLAFQDNAAQVRTISSWQVRQPIYTTAIEKWRRYEPHLGPLKEALASFYPDGLD